MLPLLITTSSLISIIYRDDCHFKSKLQLLKVGIQKPRHMALGEEIELAEKKLDP